MEHRHTLRRRVVCGLLATASALAAAGGGHQAADPALSAGERIALLRFQEIRLVAEVLKAPLWSQFDAGRMPVIIHQASSWGVAAGFDPVPAGFVRIEGVLDGDRAIYRLDRTVLDSLPRAPERPSPARVAGQWCVVMKFDLPTAMPSGSYVGRPPAEEAVAEAVGDAFLIHLMKVRSAATPLVPVPASWPESPDLMALSHIEQKILSRAIIYRPTRDTMEGFQKLIRQLQAVRRERARLLGPQAAEAEKRLENWEGFRRFVVGQVYQRFFPGKEIERAPVGEDPTFDEWRGSNPMKSAITLFPARLLPDGPATTPGQIVARTGVLTHVMEWMSFSDWREAALAGDLSLTDMMNQKIELKAEEEASYLASAKEDLKFDASRRLAEEDFGLARAAREAEIARLFPDGAGRITVRLPASRIKDQLDDPWTAIYLGDGRRLHPGGLRVSGEGIRIDLDPGLKEGALMTVSGGPTLTTGTIQLSLPRTARLTVGGKEWTGRPQAQELASGRGLEAFWAGLRLQLDAGRAERTPSGVILVTIP